MPFDYSVSAAGVVMDGERILAIRRRDNGEWHIPGGMVERGESLTAACAREVLEESGVVVVVERLSGVYHHQARGIVALVFVAHPIPPVVPHPTDESAEVAWLTLEECKQRMTGIFFQRVLDGLTVADGEAPAVREHNGVEWL